MKHQRSFQKFDAVPANIQLETNQDHPVAERAEREVAAVEGSTNTGKLAEFLSWGMYLTSKGQVQAARFKSTGRLAWLVFINLSSSKKFRNHLPMYLYSQQNLLIINLLLNNITYLNKGLGYS